MCWPQDSLWPAGLLPHSQGHLLILKKAHNLGLGFLSTSSMKHTYSRCWVVRGCTGPLPCGLFREGVTLSSPSHESLEGNGQWEKPDSGGWSERGWPVPPF